MAVSLEEFLIELYQEYLEEASFLYGQRLTLFDDPEIAWLDIQDFEDRFEPHIDGLIVGNELALEVCRRQSEEGDFGELHAAIRVFCRRNRWDLVQKVLSELDFEDEERVKGIADALSQELPDGWLPGILEMLLQEKPGFARIAANVIGFRRIPVGKELTRILERDNSNTISTVIWAMGRLRENNAGPELWNLLRTGDSSINPAIALCLLRMGETHVLQNCLQDVQSSDWPILPLGLCGGFYEAETLTNLFADRPIPDILMAIGLLGDVSGIEVLIGALVDTELADFASIALNLMTGADLYQEVFIPEEIDEDELFEEEVENLKKDENLHPVGEEPGTILILPAREQEIWSHWWVENKSRFIDGLRYRNGKPYSLICLLENLKSEKSPRLIRQLAYEELVIRYGVDFPFETDMTVVQQKKGISEFEAWVETNASRFYDGKWYLAGRVMTHRQ